MAAAVAPVDSLAINDPRVEYRIAHVRGKTYRYVLAKPPAGVVPRATAVLFHGFPDMAFGWRCQIPALAAAGFQVVVPDKLGYAGTDAPDAVEPYAMKSVIDDVLALVDAEGLLSAADGTDRLVIGGHDWGGMVAWRVVDWYADRVSAIFTVCTPYVAPNENYIDLPTMVSFLPNFAYQIQFASEELVDKTSGPDGRQVIRDMLNAMWGGGATPEERAAGTWSPAFTTEKGVQWDRIAGLSRSPHMSEAELDFYADSYARNGMRGPTNWYRARRVNYDSELPLVEARKEHEEANGGEKPRIKVPALFIAATRDAALPEAMSAGMEASFESLTRGRVEASHWALVEAAADVNEQVLKFLDGVLKTKCSI